MPRFVIYIEIVLEVIVRRMMSGPCIFILNIIIDI